jgi:EpsI family protein
LYWYDLNGRVVASMYRGKLFMMWDALTRRRTNGAVVMVAWERADSPSADAARQHAIAFVQAVIPLLPHYIPS